MASLVDKLVDDGVTAVGFDMSFSDEDLGGQFSGAKRFRSRFEGISLAAPKNKAAVDRFAEAEADISGAASALSSLHGKVRPDADPVYNTARGRLDDGKQKLTESRSVFEALVNEHAA